MVSFSIPSQLAISNGEGCLNEVSHVQQASGGFLVCLIQHFWNRQTESQCAVIYNAYQNQRLNSMSK